MGIHVAETWMFSTIMGVGPGKSWVQGGMGRGCAGEGKLGGAGTVVFQTVGACPSTMFSNESVPGMRASGPYKNFPETRVFQERNRFEGLPLQHRAVMARDGMGEEEVFLLRTATDVVNNQRRSFLRLPVGNDADVGNTVGQVPRNQVAGLVVPPRFP